MKNKRAYRGSKRNELVPTGALYPFYDSLQLGAKKPREGSFDVLLTKGTYQKRVSDGAIKIERAWADVDTKELQEWIEMFTAEVLRRALDGEEEAIQMFAWKAANLVNWLQRLTAWQREKVQQVAAISIFWPVNVTRRDTDFVWAKDYVRKLGVGSKSLLPGNPRSRIERHETRIRKKGRDRREVPQHFGRLAEELWRQLLKNQHQLPKSAPKTKWISFCLSLPAITTAQEVTAQDTPKWWRLGEALLLEAWQEDRQLAFGAVLPEYKGKYTDAFTKRDIFKRIKSAFLQLLGSGSKRMQ